MKLDIFVSSGSMKAFSRGFFERNKVYHDTPEERYLFCGNYRFRERDYNDRYYREVFDRYFKAVQRKNPDFVIEITETDPDEPEAL